MTRSSRPLVPSTSLLEALSLCATAAASVPVRGARRPKPTVSLSHLARVEQEIGAHLHDDVLVLIALADPIARLMTGLSTTMAIAEAAEDFEAPDGYVRIATVYHDPIGALVDQAHGGPNVDLFAPCAANPKPAQFLLGHAGSVEDEPITLCAFITSMLDEAVSRGALPKYGTPKATPLEIAPKLIGTAKPKSKLKRPLDAARVNHPRFGDGVVISRIGDGEGSKLVIAFAEGERTLLARFVTPLE